MPETVEVTFKAQEWIGDLPGPATRTPNTVTYEIPYDEAVTEDGTLPNDYTYESDRLAEHENAPDWVRSWVAESKGPFTVQTEVVE